MRCPYCQGNETSVIDSRPSPNEPGVRRRRQCPACQMRFSTWERVEWNLPQIRKKDGHLENYSRAKITRGIDNAVKKRSIGVREIERIADELEQLIARQKKEEIPSSMVGSVLLKKLFLLDQVSALRFASVYLRFDDLASFNDLIDRIRAMPSPEAARAQYPLMEDDDGYKD